ncbi:hypothetical protein LY28_00043 [Ruminiclostridium sufflavum DSM 19573]|uniref:Uncharacterized protein n=1 Tax=Ruminiclostridium sufflavum DSM 19573 TaxID=1121337 RepID=A0A318XTJ8_9FIRM|nr:hypothetical protein [Ruminiclostridium sufflavum]PYG90163.1 hypothetical protein LY28_00043 [Ruminiclostridium sufflavum DSM 19573]
MKTKKAKTTSKNDNKAKKDVPEKKAPIVRFFLKDGTQLDTLEGVVVPVNERTETAYRMLAEMYMK